MREYVRFDMAQVFRSASESQHWQSGMKYEDSQNAVKNFFLWNVNHPFHTAMVNKLASMKNSEMVNPKFGSSSVKKSGRAIQMKILGTTPALSSILI